MSYDKLLASAAHLNCYDYQQNLAQIWMATHCLPEGNMVTMAVIAMFYGIIVSMYYFDNRQHHVPHIHVKYQEQEVVLSIAEGAILEGSLRAKR